MAGTAGNSDDWCTIESDPGVFTELLEELGCKTVEFQELWSLDEGSIEQLKASTGSVYGFIFLFQWQSRSQASAASSSSGGADKTPLAESQIPDKLFFAHQVATNACATQAVLSIVLNAGLSAEELGPTLSEFSDFTADFPPQLKGVAISSQETIQKVHNSYGKSDAFLHDGKYVSPLRNEDSKEVYHFVAYVPHDGKVYELDGLQSGPIVTGEIPAPSDGATPTGGEWIEVARQALQTRMQNTDAIQFNCMAVLQDKRILLRSKEAESNDKDAVMAQLEEEEAKRAQWKLENQRRKHNYVPLCVSLLKELARNDQLEGLIDGAKERRQQKLAAAAASGVKAGQ
uniref:Ubiquitin carboxyl-terminal hydrolase n=1 Tax=Craspedostauros australis TaxID=1486917 RepID=A0A7R9WVH2_9STRA|mmetsp:Transcript_20529/g.57115  ORF Transcript_20529/g.57115 Transcript_20529/m.57115 type:complete len:344 (+) Transcript_20529:244-1275(+)|eukprot:CAMPEP_0198121158 /NCGR_PEP_ID=MMETSP1442-20131203/31321_1 /TAXON_ID= /ORGANISM="Craspedostauros australis, Strain CCMP3328" /LENGTH=343 /DNA_ID=CAMNT_0043779925 /DNA_START=227 /DNA_END=1258 /DNA_ORIENTATION=-